MHAIRLRVFNSAGGTASRPEAAISALDVELRRRDDGHARSGARAARSGPRSTNGAAGAGQATGVTGSLSDADMVALSSGETGFAFLAYRDAWAEIWDPTTGTMTVAELGAATGDGSTLHALATADGGFAVSWHDGSTIEASVMRASGQAGASMTPPGDLLGVNASGQAVTVYDDGQGTPVMQACTLASGAFWRG